MRVITSITRYVIVALSSAWFTLVTMIDWIGRGLLVHNLFETAPEWAINLLLTVGYAPWWIPAGILVAALGWVILRDVAEAQRERNIDGGNF